MKVAFTPGRMDASQEETDVEFLQAARTGRRRLPQLLYGKSLMAPEEALIDKAQLLKLTAPEMTVLLGGLRVLGANAGGAKHGVFTKKPETLTNDFFVNLLDMSTEWQPSGEKALRGPRPQDQGGQVDRHPRRSDLRLALAAARRRGSLCLRRRQGKFVKDFAAAWTKVMNADRFDIASAKPASQVLQSETRRPGESPAVLRAQSDLRGPPCLWRRLINTKPQPD